jgi:hypothetical protein
VSGQVELKIGGIYTHAAAREPTSDPRSESIGGRPPRLLLLERSNGKDWSNLCRVLDWNGANWEVGGVVWFKDEELASYPGTLP